MRPDEDYVKRSLEEYLSDVIGDFKIIEGEDPPDYYVQYDNTKILLEVTRADPVFLGKEGLGNRTTNDIALIRLCNQLNDEFGSRIVPPKTLLLSIKGPISNYPKFKKAIKQTISSITEDKKLLSDIYNNWMSLDIGGTKIGIILIDNLPEKKRISGLIGVVDNKELININVQTRLILENIITEKENKTKIINGMEWHGEKWLAVLNGYPLADADNYVRAIQRIKITHTFSKIFLIENDYKVTNLFNLSSDGNA
ncbi:MAG: hypothetical protein AAGU74_10300 [Bacillota bacterium]